MATFKFIGDPRNARAKDGNSMRGHGPEVTRVLGHTFQKGVPTEVPDARVASKLRGNMHFQEVGLEELAAEREAAEAAAREQQEIERIALEQANQAVKTSAAGEKDATLGAKADAAGEEAEVEMSTEIEEAGESDPFPL